MSDCEKNIACTRKQRETKQHKTWMSIQGLSLWVKLLNKKCFCRIHTSSGETGCDSKAVWQHQQSWRETDDVFFLQSRNKCPALPNKERGTWGFISPDNSMGSFSCVFLTWSDSPVSELSSIFRSLPWRRTPSAGKRSPERHRSYL